MDSKVLSAKSYLVRLVALAVPAALVVAAWPAGAAAQVGTAQYPNLRSMPPTELKLVKTTVAGQNHYEMRFKPRTYNGGPGRFEVQRVPQASGLADLKQRIYESPAGFRDESVAQTVFNPTFTFPLPDLIRYELWTKRGFARATRNGFARGAPLYVTPEVSHCVADVEPIDEGAGLAFYQECTALLVGISPGWADVESAVPPHVIDFGSSALPDGKYVLRAIVDPNNLLWESAGKADPARESQAANQGLTPFEIINGVITWNTSS
jgi:hypothetical protein